MSFRDDDALDAQVSEVRKAYHGERLDGATIVALFQEEASKRNGKPVRAKMTKASALVRFLCDEAWRQKPDFVLLVAKDLWGEASEKERRALLDHELTHCERVVNERTGDVSWRLRGHDVEEFVEVVRRHKDWSVGLREMKSELAQMDLFGEGEEPEKKPKVEPIRRNMEASTPA